MNRVSGLSRFQVSSPYKGVKPETYAPAPTWTTSIMIINERIERYVDACPAAIAGQSGHTTTFKLAIALVQGFGLNEALALPFLRRYNVRCQPPLAPTRTEA